MQASGEAAGVRTASGREATPRLSTTRLRARAGAPGIVQIVSLELALGAVAGAVWAAVIPVFVAVALAVAALVLVFARFGGRWWYDAAAAQWRLRQRRAARRKSTPAAEPRVVALSKLAAGLAIRAVDDRGRTIGVGQDKDGWFACASLGWADVSSTGKIRLELDRLVRILDETAVPVSVVQLVSYQTLAPSGTMDSAAPAVVSYRELSAPEGCSVEHALWLAVRLTPADALAASSSRGGGLAGVDRAIAAAMGRIEKALTSAGVPHQVLDAEGLRDALTYSCGLEAFGHAVPGAGVPSAQERWVAWRAGGLTHVTFTVTDWPAEPGPDLLTNLSLIPACAISVSIAVRPHGERVALLGLVRVVASPTGIQLAVNRLTRTANRLGLRLRRLDGEQASAVYASAPTGVGGIW